MKIAIYAGSFDPITKGHLWVIETAVKIFDKVIIAIGDNHIKQYSFSINDRMEMIKAVTNKITNIEIHYFKNEFLVDYAIRMNVAFIIRGIRNINDYEYERNMHNVNYDLTNKVNTIFLIPPRNYSEISSSLIKTLISSSVLNENSKKIIGKYIPEVILDKVIKLNAKFKTN